MYRRISGTITALITTTRAAMNATKPTPRCPWIKNEKAARSSIKAEDARITRERQYNSVSMSLSDEFNHLETRSALSVMFEGVCNGTQFVWRIDEVGCLRFMLQPKHCIEHGIPCI